MTSLQRSLYRSTWIPRPLEAVFPFFADAGNLERITPPELRFRVLTPLPVQMRAGALIDYRLSLFGVPFRWRTEIAAWEPPRRFVDRQLRGPYREWVHTHTFTEQDGGTRMVDEVVYALPLGRPGLLALPLVGRQLDRIFDFREATLQATLGADPAPGG